MEDGGFGRRPMVRGEMGDTGSIQGQPVFPKLTSTGNLLMGSHLEIRSLQIKLVKMGSCWIRVGLT